MTSYSQLTVYKAGANATPPETYALLSLGVVPRTAGIGIDNGVYLPVADYIAADLNEECAIPNNMKLANYCNLDSNLMTVCSKPLPCQFADGNFEAMGGTHAVGNGKVQLGRTSPLGTDPSAFALCAQENLPTIIENRLAKSPIVNYYSAGEKAAVSKKLAGVCAAIFAVAYLLQQA